jgi:GlpG protein
MMMLGWLVLCMTGILGHIGNSAHAMGLLVGVVWGWVTTLVSKPERERTADNF